MSCSGICATASIAYVTVARTATASAGIHLRRIPLISRNEPTGIMPSTFDRPRVTLHASVEVGMIEAQGHRRLPEVHGARWFRASRDLTWIKLRARFSGAQWIRFAEVEDGIDEHQKAQ